MNFCADHWNTLKQKVASAGLNDFVAPDGAELAHRVVAELKGERVTLKTFDPLFAASTMCFDNALKCVGIGLLSENPATGKPYCPVCLAEKNGHTDWLDLAVNGCREYMATLPAE